MILALIVQNAFGDSESRQPVRWGEIHESEYWRLGVIAAGALGSYSLSNQGSGGWQGGILFDNSVRGSFRASTRDGRDQASRFSDVGALLSISSPLLLDAGFFQWWNRGDRSGALRTTFITVESLLFTAFTSELTKRGIQRKRPIQSSCESGEVDDSDCNTEDSTRSFFSGHTAMAFTGAGLVCRNHRSLNLVGENTTTDFVLCASALAVATTTGVLRIIADKHYSSDVLVGASIGFFSGYFLPVLFHSPESSSGSFMVLPLGRDAVSLVKTFRF